MLKQHRTQYQTGTRTEKTFRKGVLNSFSIPFSLKPYAAGGMDGGDDVAGEEECQEAGDEGEEVDQQEVGPTEEYWHGIHIIYLGIEMHYASVMLDGQQSQSQEVAIEHTTQYDEGRIMQEEVTHLAVGGSHRLHHANEIGTLKDDDEQAADHGEACHTSHEYEYHPNIQVEQMQPGEYLGIEFAYGHRGILGTIGILLLVDGLHHSSHHLVELAEILGQQFGSRLLVAVPAQQSMHGVQVGKDDAAVEVRQMGAVDAAHTETSGFDCILEEIGIDGGTYLKLQLACQMLRHQQAAR